MTNQKIYIGKKEAAMPLPLSMPNLDDEQTAAAEHMTDNPATLLFSDPGAGKTLTALDALMLMEYEGKDCSRTAVICPTIAIRNWAVWIAKVYQVYGLNAYIQIIQGNTNVEILPATTHVIVTYGTIGRKASKALRAIRDWWPNVLICDESDNLNNVDSQRTVAVLGPAGLALDVDKAWFLTGTPIPRYNDGLWPVLNACFKDRLKQYFVATKTNFIQQFCVERSVKYGGMRFPVKKVVGNRNKLLLNSLLYDSPPIAIRNKLKLRDKPVFGELTVKFKPSAELLQMQKNLTAEQEVEVDDFGNPVKVVDPETAKALHLYGVETAPAIAEMLCSLLEHKTDGSGILVLFWHREVGKLLQQFLMTKHGVRCTRIDGSTTSKTRDHIVDTFNSGETRMLLGQISAMGVALNLQENCHHVVFAEDTYSDAMNMQAYQRVWRRGQTQTVQVDFCRSLLPMSNMRFSVAERKGKDAKEVLDG